MLSPMVKLAIAGACPVLAAAILSGLQKTEGFRKLDDKIQQLIFGIIFGLIAVGGTEFGIPINGAQMNCRDAAVLTAGLFFGAPAGILAGLIGGIERWIAVAWGVGTFTRVACTVSTILAGFYSAALRNFMFERKRPGMAMAFAVGLVMEVFHITMIFVTNMNAPVRAMAAVSACGLPMIVANAVSVGLAALVVDLISGKYREREEEHQSLSHLMQRAMLIAVIFSFLLSSFFIWRLHSSTSRSQADALLNAALDETCSDLRREAAENGGGLPMITDPIVSDTHSVGENGLVLLTDAAGTGVMDFRRISRENTTFRAVYQDQWYYCRWRQLLGRSVLAMMPESEVLRVRNITAYANSFMEIMNFAILFALIYQIIGKFVVKEIHRINRSLKKITDGDLDEEVAPGKSLEFRRLSAGINQTVESLKKANEETKARMEAELELARNIQKSALPGVFPAFPKRKEFDIYATMDAAKEVGGDFYDFYFTEQNTLNFIVADVSGKGIPGALFMMKSKTELKGLAETSIPLNEVFTRGNAALCEGNDAEMFVTAWQGSINLDTGLVQYVNAGHNPPLLKSGDGPFEYLRTRCGFVLAGMDGMKYKMQEFQMKPGDILFLYTDGVTEATNLSNELYGEDRLCELLNSRSFTDMKDICLAVKADTDAFVGEAPQFDDMTMLAFRYAGSEPVPEISFREAAIADIVQLTDFVEQELEKCGCPMKTVAQINVAVDEIYSNIAKYAYPNGPGPVTVSLRSSEDPRSVTLRFADMGLPYNPLLNEDPDVSLSAEEREIGGLGIFIVRKTMDDVRYKREDGMNIMTITKNF